MSKAVTYYRQATDQLADALRLDGSSLMQQALKQGVLDPEHCCMPLKHNTAGFALDDPVMRSYTHRQSNNTSVHDPHLGLALSSRCSMLHVYNARLDRPGFLVMLLPSLQALWSYQ